MSPANYKFFSTCISVFRIYLRHSHPRWIPPGVFGPIRVGGNLGVGYRWPGGALGCPLRGQGLLLNYILDSLLGIVFIYVVGSGVACLPLPEEELLNPK